MDTTATTSDLPSTEVLKPRQSFQGRLASNLAEFPWWALVIALAGVILTYSFLTDVEYQKILSSIWLGIRLTTLLGLESIGIPPQPDQEEVLFGVTSVSLDEL